MPRLKTPQPSTRREAIPLWPDAGERLGFSRNHTYATAKRGQFPGAKKLGGRWVVFVPAFERALEGKE
jgi:predicted DNA-binding transcriptional regulator AlpA